MTKEQAIKSLKRAKEWMNSFDYEVYYAIEFAINALQADPRAPDWSQAPDGFDWYAIDADGSGVWYEKEPIKLDDGYSGKCLSWKHIDKSFMKLYKRPDQ